VKNNLTNRNLGSNQAVNFTAYTEFKELLQKWQPQYADSPIPSYQTTIIGLVSGAMGPLSNAPIDTIKTRLQKTPAQPGETALSRITAIAKDMFRYVGTNPGWVG
jgi:solute carrier family 25 (mitochondrial citrate transporter), member 1